MAGHQWKWATVIWYFKVCTFPSCMWFPWLLIRHLTPVDHQHRQMCFFFLTSLGSLLTKLNHRSSRLCSLTGDWARIYGNVCSFIRVDIIFLSYIFFFFEAKLKDLPETLQIEIEEWPFSLFLSASLERGTPPLKTSCLSDFTQWRKR